MSKIGETRHISEIVMAFDHFQPTQDGDRILMELLKDLATVVMEQHTKIVQLENEVFRIGRYL